MAISRKKGAMRKAGQQRSSGSARQAHQCLLTQSLDINKEKETQYSFPSVQKETWHGLRHQ